MRYIAICLSILSASCAKHPGQDDFGDGKTGSTDVSAVPARASKQGINPADLNTKITSVYQSHEDTIAHGLHAVKRRIESQDYDKAGLAAMLRRLREACDEDKKSLNDVDTRDDADFNAIVAKSIQLIDISKEMLSDEFILATERAVANGQSLSQDPRLAELNLRQRTLKNEIIAIQKDLSKKHGFSLRSSPRP